MLVCLLSCFLHRIMLISSIFTCLLHYPILSSCDESVTPRSLLNKILNENYDINFWPNAQQGVATDVNVQIFINSFGSLDATHMDYRLDIFLRQMWQDPRLKLSFKNFSRMTIQDEVVRKLIWKPDTFFENAKEASSHSTTTPNVLFRIDSEGNILYSVRLKLKVSCFLDLREYPMDTQKCFLTLASYANTDEVIKYHWSKESPIDIADDVEMAQFDLVFKETANETYTYVTGNFSGLSATFTLRRQMGYHILQSYIPTVLIVAISWVSFWLDPNAIPGRVTLGVTTLLTLTTLASGIRQHLPPVSYVKSIDIWIGMCMIMVFGALLEFTLSNWLANRKRSSNLFIRIPKCLLACSTPEEENNEREMNGDGLQSSSVRQPKPKFPTTYMDYARAVDRISRVLFPSTFFIFNLIYWSYYLTEQVKKTTQH